MPDRKSIGLKAMPRRALLLVNRNASGGQIDVARLREHLTAGGLELIDPTASEGDDGSAAIRRCAGRVDLVIVGGGDGTINRALQGLLDTRLPFGVLPLGTANDLARTLELPTDPFAACDVILHGELRPIDVGLANDRPFLNVASIGLAVEVTKRLTRETKSRWGVLAYAWAAIGAMPGLRPFTVEIGCDGKFQKTRTWQVTVGNGRSYGGGLTIHEDARIDDGLLNLYSVEVERGWHILTLIPALWRGSLGPLRNVRTLSGRRIEIRMRRRRSLTADGELVGHTPAVFQILPGALSVYVPTTSTHAAG
jgi:diacylglycerol kinase (ATP)